MGRKPIAKYGPAMTATEHQRRWRAKKAPESVGKRLYRLWRTAPISAKMDLISLLADDASWGRNPHEAITIEPKSGRRPHTLIRIRLFNTHP